ncbi:MAG: hypothetical protein EBQ58_00645 [Betaproteobacteria bacterium]|nr:hypothetical protein [Betaproteobacteria bacterium]
MILQKFRSGLLGRFVKFGVLPSVLVVVAVVATTTYLSVTSKQKDARELATTEAEYITSKGETFDQKAIGTVTAMALLLKMVCIPRKPTR